MENILTIKERILSFLEVSGIKKVDFFEATGIQSSNFKGKNMSSQPGGDMLVKVLTLYPEISAEWLMRGEGGMLKVSHATLSTKQKNTIAHQVPPEVPPMVIDKLLTTIQAQAEEIGQLRERINQLERVKNASTAHTEHTANVG